MSDLVEFLLARLAEDERLAAEQDLDRAGDPYSDGSGIADRDGFPSYRWGSEGTELQFMAGPGHPARVLAEVRAKRRIIELHTPVGDDPGGPDYCNECERYDATGTVCPTLRLLALPYASHEAYRPEWVL